LVAYSHLFSRIFTLPPPFYASPAVSGKVIDKTLGRAEALRRAMLAMIDKGAPRETHPAFWAPFVVVGEGAAGRVGAALPHGTKSVSKPPRKAKEDWSAEIWKKQP
jgi:hypothetical protein